MENADIKYLKVLATQYPNIAAAATEIVNLKAILSLPKATELLLTDVHGEYEQFQACYVQRFRSRTAQD